MVDVSSLLFAAFHILTAMATLVYRRRVLAVAGDAIVLGILPVIGVVLLGLVMLAIARFVLHSPFSGSRGRATRQSAERLGSPVRGARPGTV